MMRNLVLIVGLAAGCSRMDSASVTSKAPIGIDSSPSPALAQRVAAVPGMLLGRVPTTSSYRVIACTLGPEKQHTCEGMLARLVGAEVRGENGDVVKVAKTVSLKTNRGAKPAVELTSPKGKVMVSGSAALLHKSATLTDAETKLLRTQVRGMSPRAKWATSERFEVSALVADLDGDHNIDRVAVGTIVDIHKDDKREVVGIAVGLAGKAFEIVDMSSDRVRLIGTIDLDGDGRDEVLVDRTLVDRTYNGDADNYRYQLMHVLAGKRLAMGKSFSEGWWPYDFLESQPSDQDTPAP